MIDREKVINDLQDAVNDDWIWQHADYYALTMERAIALLKEQEPALPTWSQGKAYCGNCGQKFPRKRENKEINYCGCCGQEVKWK